jgi:hypothetical protein
MYRTFAMRLPFSPVQMLIGIALLLMLTYVALIAIVTSYAALTVSFSQSVRNDEASVATLESTYLNKVAELTNTDYTAMGYTKPVASLFVPGAPTTALR